MRDSDDQNLSMLEKSKQKKKIKKTHEGNTMAGSIKGDEHHLHRTGVRGRKIIFLVAFLIILALLCLINLVIMVFLYSVLDIHSNGMASMSFFKEDRAIKWILDGDFENIVLDDDVIGGFSDKSVQIHGDEQNVTLNVDNLLTSSLNVTPVGTFIKSNRFLFVNPDSKKKILDISRSEIVGEFNGKSFTTNSIRTPRVVSDHLKELTFLSTVGGINVTGNEGLFSDSKVVNAIAANDIIFKIKNSRYGLTFGGFNRGLALDHTKIQSTKNSDAVVTTAEKYRLCMCLSTNELFIARITSKFITCAIAVENPC